MDHLLSKEQKMIKFIGSYSSLFCFKCSSLKTSVTLSVSLNRTLETEYSRV